jgi:acyl-CoA synthetase (AMP-forming)/AMP-acid ligase II
MPAAGLIYGSGALIARSITAEDAIPFFPIPDEEFGQRLKAVVVKKRGTRLDQSTLVDWLKPRVARYQMPAVIEFREELPYTSLGKLDKKLLRC